MSTIKGIPGLLAISTASVYLAGFATAAGAEEIGNGNDGGFAGSIAISGGTAPAVTNSNFSIAVGQGATVGANSDMSSAIGRNSSVGEDSHSSNAIGYEAHIRDNAAASNAYGRQSEVGAGSSGSNAIGYSAKVGANSSNATAIGRQAHVGDNASGAQAIGTGTASYAIGGSAIGLDAQVGVGSTSSTAVGRGAVVGENAQSAIASGHGATVGDDATRGIAMGYNANVNAGGSVAIGERAAANGTNSVALGARSVADEDDVVSVGAAGRERKVVNVAAGVAETDAVNVSQLRNVEDFAVKYDEDPAGSPDYSSITLGSGMADAPPTVVRNLAAGTISSTSTEAVNGAQVHAVSSRIADAFGGNSTVLPDGTISNPVYNVAGGSYTNVGSALTALDDRIDGMEANLQSSISREASRAAAVGLAAASLRFDDRPGKLSVAMGAGYWQDHGAMAFGLGYTNQQQNIRANINAATTGSQWGVGAGVSFTLN